MHTGIAAALSFECARQVCCWSGCNGAMAMIRNFEPLARVSPPKAINLTIPTTRRCSHRRSCFGKDAEIIQRTLIEANKVHAASMEWVEQTQRRQRDLKQTWQRWRRCWRLRWWWQRVRPRETWYRWDSWETGCCWNPWELSQPVSIYNR